MLYRGMRGRTIVSRSNIWYFWIPAHCSLLATWSLYGQHFFLVTLPFSSTVPYPIHRLGGKGYSIRGCYHGCCGSSSGPLPRKIWAHCFSSTRRWQNAPIMLIFGILNCVASIIYGPYHIQKTTSTFRFVKTNYINANAMVMKCWYVHIIMNIKIIHHPIWLKKLIV